MDPLKRLKGEPSEALQARIIRERAKGRCEYEWFEGHQKRRCTELHNERAVSFDGRVQLQLMPTAGLTDRRVCNLKAYCQHHAYALLREMQNGVGFQPRKTKTDPSQTDLLAASEAGVYT